MGLHGKRTQPPGLEARERLEAFQDAKRHVERAEHLLVAAIAARDAAPDVAFRNGADLAEMRLAKATSHFNAALAVLADGRPPYEAFWRLPDD